MKKVAFIIKKLSARVMVAVGSLLGVSSCFLVPSENVYGPPPECAPDIDNVEVVYGPPPIEDSVAVPDTALLEDPSPVEQGDMSEMSSEK